MKYLLCARIILGARHVSREKTGKLPALAGPPALTGPPALMGLTCW